MSVGTFSKMQQLCSGQCAPHAQNITHCLSICPAARIPYSDILCILFQPLPSAWQPTLSQTLLSMRPSCLSVCLSACPSVCPSSFLHSLNSSLGLLLLPASALPAQCPTPISDNTPFFRIIWGEMKVKKISLKPELSHTQQPFEFCYFIKKTSIQMYL